MKPVLFAKHLLVASLIAVVFIFALGQIAALAAFMDLAWASMFVFTVLSITMYAWGYYTVKHHPKNHFINVFMTFTFFKMFFSFGIVAIYFFATAPRSKFFVLPFFAIYLVYTVFEVSFMTKLGSTNAASLNQ